MKLTIVRHGETIENAAGIYMGHLHGKLSSAGKKQATALAKSLANEKFDIIYCSDLNRCKDTAKEIAKYHKTTPLKFSKELRERNVGVFQNKHRDSVDWDSLEGSFMNQKPKNGESLQEMKKRISDFLKVLKAKHMQSVLLVTHGGVIRMIHAVLMKIPFVEISKFKPGNTSIFEYVLEGSKVGVRRYNETKHL